jgi:protein TonB
MKTLLTIALSLGSLFSFSQNKESFYVLDTNWQQTVVDSAKYLLWIHVNDDGNWSYNYYHMWGSMIKMETFKDHDGTQRNGLACYYYKTGDLDSVAHYQDGKKEGSFFKFAYLPHDSLHLKMAYQYAKDSLLSVRNYDKDTSGDRKNQDSTANKESEYTGGQLQWSAFLGKNLHYPDRAIGNEIQGEVRILFSVTRQGEVIEPVVFKSVEYSLDREAMRIIKLSGKWEPGLRHGEPAETVKLQPIRFVLQAQ